MSQRGRCGIDVSFGCSNLGASTAAPPVQAGASDAVQEQVDAATTNAMAVAQANLTNAQETLNEVKNEMSK